MSNRPDILIGQLFALEKLAKDVSAAARLLELRIAERLAMSSVEYTRISTWRARMSASRPFLGPRMLLLKRRRRSQWGYESWGDLARLVQRWTFNSGAESRTVRVIGPTWNRKGTGLAGNPVTHLGMNNSRCSA
jgi:hypothetical protein